MVALQNVSNLQMRVEALVVDGGRTIRALQPDALGYYNNVPVAALGVATRNRTYYDVPSFMRQIEDPSTPFNIRLRSSQLFGELGHPYIAGLPQELALARLAHIEEKNSSHQFGGFNVSEQTMEDGGKLLFAKVKPSGVHAAVLDASLRDPTINTGFSLRAISTAQIKAGLSWRTIKNLVTFDAVNTGGFAQASKLYVPTTENFHSFDIQVRPFEHLATFDQISLECFTDTELNEYFGARRIGFYRHVTTVVTSDEPRAFSEITARQARSLFHDHFKE